LLKNQVALMSFATKHWHHSSKYLEASFAHRLLAKDATINQIHLMKPLRCLY